ncbi:hypothetical protein HanRHA438_Chr11g0518361 [Helianthus annuus]|uniref:Uncharacterized protein n=1 Tax=Helianthus annuus TaxID=4232 RepID=A0A9K3N1P4_HELAN|nr:hypothetical protein HanXRQr2_Chr11g0505741 [Helianthus annuus]KAJ0871958.1 hypothetical protein HanRHA438_Chr11g0518361 [Helianthus annuus]
MRGARELCKSNHGWTMRPHPLSAFCETIQLTKAIEALVTDYDNGFEDVEDEYSQINESERTDALETYTGVEALIYLAWGLSCYLYVQYCIYYFSRSNMNGFLQSTFFFCYNILFCSAFFTMLK